MAEDKDGLDDLEGDEGEGATQVVPAGFVRPGELLAALKARAGINPTRGLFVGNELRVPKEGDDEDYGSVNEGQAVDSLVLLTELMPEVEWERVEPEQVVGLVKANVHDFALIVVNGVDIGSFRAGCVDMPKNVALLPDLVASPIVDTSRIVIASVNGVTTPAGLRNLINAAFYRRVDFLKNVEPISKVLTLLKEAMAQISSNLEMIRASIPRHELNERRQARVEAEQFPVDDEEFDKMIDESNKGVERIGLALDQFQETLPVLDVAQLGHHVRNPLGYLKSNLDTLIADIQLAELKVPEIINATRETVVAFQGVVNGYIRRFKDA